MTTAFFRLLVIGAACSMWLASAQAQSGSQNAPPSDLSSNNTSRSWSTKRLSATGRTADHSMRASKLIGAQVNDTSHNRIGQIQDIIVNPDSGRIDFALLSLGAGPAAGAKSVPVPWPLLKTAASSQYATTSEQPVFTLNADQSKLSNAPTVSESDLGQSQWRQRIYSYYGVSPDPATESPHGNIKGEGALKLQESPDSPPPPNP